jgi:hypothetical protein
MYGLRPQRIVWVQSYRAVRLPGTRCVTGRISPTACHPGWSLTRDSQCSKTLSRERVLNHWQKPSPCLRPGQETKVTWGISVTHSLAAPSLQPTSPATSGQGMLMVGRTSSRPGLSIGQKAMRTSMLIPSSRARRVGQTGTSPQGRNRCWPLLQLLKPGVKDFAAFLTGLRPPMIEEENR